VFRATCAVVADVREKRKESDVTQICGLLSTRIHSYTTVNTVEYLSAANVKRHSQMYTNLSFPDIKHHLITKVTKHRMFIKQNKRQIIK